MVTISKESKTMNIFGSELQLIFVGVKELTENIIRLRSIVRMPLLVIQATNLLKNETNVLEIRATFPYS